MHFKKMKKKLKKNTSIYDPRVGVYVISTNPALILAELIKEHVERNDNFWQNIAELADYCDEKK